MKTIMFALMAVVMVMVFTACGSTGSKDQAAQVDSTEVAVDTAAVEVDTAAVDSVDTAQ